jgi:hypothetical protein
LGALDLLLVDASRGRQEIGAELVADVAAGLLAGGLRNLGGVGAHVSDKTDLAIAAEGEALVELLGDAHRPLRGEAQPPRCLLLEGAGYERRRRPSYLLLLLDGGHSIGGAPEQADDAVGLGLCADLQLGPLSGQTDKTRSELRGPNFGFELGLDCPILLRHEGLDFPLSLNHQSKRHRLHASRG